MGESNHRPIWLWAIVVALAVIGPAMLSFVAWIVMSTFAGSIDVAWALGISDEVANGIMIGGGGLLAGLLVAAAARIRGWKLAIPALVGLAAGVGLYLALGAPTDDAPLFLLWGAQTVAIVMTTWLTPVAARFQEEEEKPREVALLT